MKTIFMGLLLLLSVGVLAQTQPGKIKINLEVTLDYGKYSFNTPEGKTQIAKHLAANKDVLAELVKTHEIVNDPEIVSLANEYKKLTKKSLELQISLYKKSMHLTFGKSVAFTSNKDLKELIVKHLKEQVQWVITTKLVREVMQDFSSLKIDLNQCKA